MDSLPARACPPPARRGLALALLASLVLAGSGCASSGGVGKAVGKALETVGLKAPAPPAPPQEHSVPLRLYAADNLNAGGEKRPLALVVRVYQLRAIQRFEQAPFDAFLDEKAEAAALGTDLVSASEILLTPGQRHEVIEKVAAEASHLGIVALFRAPTTSRWRFAFDSRKAVKDGITVGLHACAMTTTSTALETPLASESHSLSSVNCAPGKR
ncbi:type VI secretion system lipoprotein TssJ [Lysobacter cavernae]|uniref:Type VI secretion system lipoprotein TssJ n=1 Tax=Lysobacter cavernae TaxID=1685901 RepID=A0ABV7RSD5_9GAMM